MKKLAKSDPLNRDIFKQLQVPNNSTKPALFYGSVKIHKEGYPLRPIVSAVGSATYYASSYVNKVLSTYAEQIPSFVKNTADFIEKIKTMTIEDDEIMW